VPEPLTIQPCSYDDPDAVELTCQVQDLYRQLYGGTDDTPMTAEEFTPPSGTFLLGYRGEEAVAMGGWRFLPGRPSGAQRPVEIKRMFVRPELRGHGYGRQMLLALETSAAAAGADWVLLSTGEPQVEAVGLYRRSGYREVPPFGFFACTPAAIHLGRPLGGDQARFSAAS
jgi:GNAT superfamily N-acetyltransferase